MKCFKFALNQDFTARMVSAVVHYWDGDEALFIEDWEFLGLETGLDRRLAVARSDGRPPADAIYIMVSRNDAHLV